MLTRKLLTSQIETDPYWSSVTLYVKANNGSIADVSSSGRTLTVSGNTAVSSGATLFGEQSIYFDGSGDSIVAPSALYINGSSSFTVDYWVNRVSGDTDAEMLSSSSNNFNFFHGGTLGMYTGATNQVTDQVLYDVWNHYALVRNGTTFNLYLNGVSKLSFTLSTSYSSIALNIMRNFGNTTQVKGYVHSLRVTSGVARYTSNFSVPTSPFPTS